MSDLGIAYIIICVGTDQLPFGCLEAVVRPCHLCKTSVWYNPAGDPSSPGQSQLECINCAAERYQQEEDLPLPVVTEATRQHLRSLGLSAQRIEDILFQMAVDLLGRKRRRSKG